MRERTTAALCAQAIRKELKEKIPNVVFRVESKNYSGGHSVSVYYVDGPRREKVEAITNKYRRGHFNGMIDLYEDTNVRTDIPQVDYVHVNREMSEAAKTALITAHNAKWAPEYAITGDPDKWSKPFNCWENQVVFKEFSEVDIFAPYIVEAAKMEAKA